MIQYTPNAVNKIKEAVNDGVPSSQIRAHLGWDASMFDSICRRHGIDAHAPRDVDLPAPPPVKASPAPLPKAAAKRGAVNVTVALKPDVLAKIEKYAERAGVSRHRAAGSIVSEYVLTVGASQIAFLSRADYGSSKDASVISVGVEEECWMTLYHESQRRRMKSASIGVLVRACLVRYFE
jgi:hypothetical protein